MPVDRIEYGLAKREIEVRHGVADDAGDDAA